MGNSTLEVPNLCLLYYMRISTSMCSDKVTIRDPADNGLDNRTIMHTNNIVLITVLGTSPVECPNCQAFVHSHDFTQDIYLPLTTYTLNHIY